MRRILLRKHTGHSVFLKGKHITSLCPWPTECGIHGMLYRAFYRPLYRIYRMLCRTYRPMYRVFSGLEESRNQLPMSSQEAATQGCFPITHSMEAKGQHCLGSRCLWGESVEYPVISAPLWREGRPPVPGDAGMRGGWQPPPCSWQGGLLGL